MKPFVKHKGIVAPVDRGDVDTDQMVPKQFLKMVTRDGFGRVLFYDWRYLSGGDANPDFVLNKPRYHGASICLARNNFGCGSSREHAPWAFLEYGFRTIVASGFGDIFYVNCFKNGILPVVLDPTLIDELFYRNGENPGYMLTVNLEDQSVSDEFGFSATFEVNQFRKECLLRGLDEVELTLLQEDKIAAFESRNLRFPVANGPVDIT
jgi:3-isopropylmalate/(R)-2-methylmalate dehydratase small subunit